MSDDFNRVAPAVEAVRVEPTGDRQQNGAGAQAARLVVGKVASPQQRESTVDRFYFWVPNDELVERTQIVWTESQIGGEDLEFYAVVDEVFRQSRKQSIGEEFDTFDGDLGYQPPFAAEGITYASASILRAERRGTIDRQAVLTPPENRAPST